MMEDRLMQDLSPLGEVQADVALAKRTTMAVGGAARWLFRPSDASALQQAMTAIPATVRILPLGRGSNLLINDQGFDGLVLDLGAMQHIQRDGDMIQAGAGARMPKLAQYAAKASLAGLEFMATVPGDVGGGVAMNAGAFGQQLSDSLLCIQVVLRDGSLQKLDAEVLQMNYRHTILPSACVVVEASMSLKRAVADDIRQRMREMRQKRSESQPLDQPNCGSVFKNPTGDFAARLIEQAGLKGHRLGQAQISSTHANFIVNHGGATASDVLALIRLAQLEVKVKFGVKLEPEVRILGES